MSLPLPNPSSRLLRAAAAEQAELVRHRERLTREREQLATELFRVDDALSAVDDRLAILAHLVGPDDSHDPGESADALDASAATGQRTILRGPAIREVAVQILIARPEHIEALHYRRWYELLQEAGYAVAGKDPLAVFLTQVSRSPVVHKATEPGTYEVDRQAPLRIRQRLERLQGELRDLAVGPQGAIELSIVRARRHELDLAISQEERALEEALRVLRRTETDKGSLSTASAG